MSDELVHIYSDEHKTYWRPGACGYTREPEEAGVWERREAEARIAGCGPEKQLRLIAAAPTESLHHAAGAVLKNNGGLIDSVDGPDTYVMVRREDFKALEAAYKRMG